MYKYATLETYFQFVYHFVPYFVSVTGREDRQMNVKKYETWFLKEGSETIFATIQYID